MSTVFDLADSVIRTNDANKKTWGITDVKGTCVVNRNKVVMQRKVVL
jgi:hypothetical protein